MEIPEGAVSEVVIASELVTWFSVGYKMDVSDL
jgi:hypothetical protein